MNDTLLSQFNKWVTKHTGIYFQRARWKDLERIVNKTYCEFGYKNADAFVEDALSSSLRGEHEEHFINHLTIGETYFFREKRSLDIFEHQILPELIESRKNSSKHIRIWCSASSSGEEAYSIAIILSRVALL
ncbi:MAG: chemotaxis protein CheR, partial [Candidatus Brocadiales bacterium]|nr:chemotaxis protein CheR [Candidatus Brocadiales bacterium]